MIAWNAYESIRGKKESAKFFTWCDCNFHKMSNSQIKENQNITRKCTKRKYWEKKTNKMYGRVIAGWWEYRFFLLLLLFPLKGNILKCVYWACVIFPIGRFPNLKVDAAVGNWPFLSEWVDGLIKHRFHKPLIPLCFFGTGGGGGGGWALLCVRAILGIAGVAKPNDLASLVD